MKLNTMASVMTFVSKLENDSASFYEEAAKKYPDLAGQYQARVKENKRFEKQVKQTYFGIITDTLESNYCFESLDSDDYPLDTEVPGDAQVAAGKAVELEKTIIGFYSKAADLSEGLMADIPRLFKKIAKKRESRM